MHVAAATAAHCSAAVRGDHDTLPAAGWSQRCSQFANVVQTAAALSDVVCSSKPLLHECVATTAPVDAYERSTLSKETIPSVSAAIESHFAATHVGAMDHTPSVDDGFPELRPHTTNAAEPDEKRYP